MRDSGVPSRAERSKLAKVMAKTVQDRMMNWTEDNFTYFEQTMDMIREGAPVQWVKLYMEAVKLGLDKSTNINININRQQDRDNLQALVRNRLPSLPQSAPSYTPYIEVPQQVKVEEHEREAATTIIR